MTNPMSGDLELAGELRKLQFRQIEWKYEAGLSIWGGWYGDLVHRYFIWPEGANGKFRVSVGYKDKVGVFATLEAAKKAAQAEMQRVVMTALKSTHTEDATLEAPGKGLK